MSKDNSQSTDIFDHNYYAEPVECDACNKKFCHTVRKNDSDERFCKMCFHHRYGMEDTIRVLKLMEADDVASMIWEVPHNELTEDVKSKLNYYVKQEEQS